MFKKKEQFNFPSVVQMVSSSDFKRNDHDEKIDIDNNELFKKKDVDNIIGEMVGVVNSGVHSVFFWIAALLVTAGSTLMYLNNLNFPFEYLLICFGTILWVVISYINRDWPNIFQHLCIFLISAYGIYNHFRVTVKYITYYAIFCGLANSLTLSCNNIGNNGTFTNSSKQALHVIDELEKSLGYFERIGHLFNDTLEDISEKNKWLNITNEYDTYRNTKINFFSIKQDLEKYYNDLKQYRHDYCYKSSTVEKFIGETTRMQSPTTTPIISTPSSILQSPPTKIITTNRDEIIGEHTTMHIITEPTTTALQTQTLATEYTTTLKTQELATEYTTSHIITEPTTTLKTQELATKYTTSHIITEPTISTLGELANENITIHTITEPTTTLKTQELATKYTTSHIITEPTISTLGELANENITIHTITEPITTTLKTQELATEYTTPPITTPTQNSNIKIIHVHSKLNITSLKNLDTLNSTISVEDEKKRQVLIKNNTRHIVEPLLETTQTTS